MGVLWGKMGEELVQCWPPNKLVLTSRCFYVLYVPILVKIDQEMRPWECAQMKRHTQTQNGFIIYPMLYAIAMGQIITFSFFWLEFDAVVKLRSRSATRCLEAFSRPDSSSISAGTYTVIANLSHYSKITQVNSSISEEPLLIKD